MAHTPVNHPLRPVYRAVAALVGIYLVLFGVVAFISTAGDGLFGRGGERVFGQGANLCYAILAVVVGAVVLAATAIGRNRDTVVNTYLGWALLVIGTLSLTLIRTDANVLDFSVATVVVTYLAGLALILAGLYGKTAPHDEAGAPRQVREGRPEAGRAP